MMEKMINKKWLDISFDIGLLLKGLFAVGEILCGAAVLFLTPDRVTRLVEWISRAVLSRDPDDWLMTHLVIFGQSFTFSAQHFAMFYLLSHGIVKLVVILLLWKRRLWAYPVSVAVFIGFIVYQMIHFASGHSVLLLLLTALDIVMIILTIFEYREIKAKGKVP